MTVAEHQHLWGPVKYGLFGTSHRKCQVRDCTWINAYDDDEGYDVLDKFGRWWPTVSFDERCDECGQPDNCGDCNHEPLSDADVALLGGIVPKLDGTDTDE